MVELRPSKELNGFVSQARKAFWHKKEEIEDVRFDLKEYDLICLGTPVWAFGPAPAMNTYLEKCFGVESKKVILFATYGSGAGKNRCLNYMRRILSKKGVKDFGEIFVQQGKTRKREEVEEIIKTSLSL